MQTWGPVKRKRRLVWRVCCEELRGQGLKRRSQAMAGLRCCPSEAMESHGWIALEDNCGHRVRVNRDKTGAGCRPWRVFARMQERGGELIQGSMDGRERKQHASERFGIHLMWRGRTERGHGCHP